MAFVSSKFAEVAYIPLRIDASLYQSGILEVLELVRPQWKHDTVKFKEFKGGLTNLIVGVKSGEEDILLIRVYGRNTEKFINRESEIKNLVYLNKHIGTPPVYAHFDNGLCYGYVKGAPLELNDLYDKMMMRRIARELARIHALPLPAEDANKPLLYDVFFTGWLNELPKSLETEARTARCVCVCVRTYCTCVCLCTVLHLSLTILLGVKLTKWYLVKSQYKVSLYHTAQKRCDVGKKAGITTITGNILL